MDKIKPIEYTKLDFIEYALFGDDAFIQVHLNKEQQDKWKIDNKPLFKKLFGVISKFVPAELKKDYIAPSNRTPMLTIKITDFANRPFADIALKRLVRAVRDFSF